MKLRNKKTGEIGELSIWHRADNNEITGFAVIKENEKFPTDYKNLAELNEEWEDAPEERSFWHINEQGVVEEYPPSLLDRKGIIGNYKRVGNYFETKEEAEKAVEKLKAWKRLKDKGFEFTGWDRHPDYPGDFRITASDEWTCDDKDLDLLFGGKE